MANLIMRMLAVDPAARPTVEELLNDPYFAPAQGKKSTSVPKSSSTGVLGRGRVSSTANRVLVVRPQMTVVARLTLGRIL
jgi:serine/threonine protein kinase